MATVKSIDSTRQQAKPTSNKPQPKSDGKAVVKVVKNGIERTFPRSIWDNLPADKEGYQEVVAKPEIPEQKPAPEPKPEAAPAPEQGNVSTPAPTDAQSPTYDEAVKAYTDLFKEVPGQDLTIDEILGKITAKQQEGK